MEQAQTVYKEYTKLCTHGRKLSWNQLINECNNIRGMKKIKAAKGAGPRAPTHPMPRKEVDSLCDSFAQRRSLQNLPEDTINKLTQMVPARVRTITTANYEAVETDQWFTPSELLHRLKDTAPGDNTVCYSMIKNAPVPVSSLGF